MTSAIGSAAASESIMLRVSFSGSQALNSNPEADVSTGSTSPVAATAVVGRGNDRNARCKRP